MVMKIRKGKVKIESKDYRIGNFVITEEKEHIKFMDINQQVSHRVSKLFLVKGCLMSGILEQARKGDENANALLESYLVVMHNVLCCFPFTKDDFNYLERLNDATVECFKRNSELYGVKNDPSDAENEQSLEAVRGAMELEKKLEELD